MAGKTPRMLIGLTLALGALLGQTNAATATPDEGYYDKCVMTLTSCRGDDNPICVAWRRQYVSHGNNCPGYGDQPSSGAAASALSSPNAVDRLGQISGECDRDYGAQSFSGQVKCLNDKIGVSQELAAATISGDTKLFQLTAENLVDEVRRKKISQAGARVELQKAFLEFRDHVNRQSSEVQARADAAETHARQAEVGATAAREAENNRRANAQMIADAQDREFKRRHEELVAFCVATAKQKINANPLYVNQNYFSGIHPDASCESDPYWYKTIPSLQSQVGGRVLQ
jgi:hypothetical protein